MVSVIIATYNRCNLLKRAIESVLKQTYRNFEVIVVDDASGDETYKMISISFKSFIDKGTIRYYRNEINKERSFCRNLGMKEAKGEYFAFLDDDDEWLLNHLENLVKFLDANPDVGVAFSNCYEVFEDGGRRLFYAGIKTGKGKWYRDLCIDRYFITGSAYIIRGEVYEKLGGFKEGLEPSEDREYLARIAMNYNVGYSSIPTVYKYTHSGSYGHLRSHNKLALAREKTWYAIKANSVKVSYPIKPRIECRWLLHLSLNFLPDLDKTKYYLIEAVKIYPWCFLWYITWRLFLRIIVGKRIYIFLRALKQKYFVNNR